jgi:predicted lipoprotein with Yx(FWY)xxD motif
VTLHSINIARGQVRRAVVASALVLGTVAALSACGKNITISDAPDPSASAPSSPVSAPASPAVQGAVSSPPAAGAAAGNAGLQVVDTTAAQAGLSGTGGTVVGAAVQEQPPKWVQLSAVTSPPLSQPHLININQAALYRFDKDTAGSGQSACNDACATQWPPVTVAEGGKAYLAGVDPKDVGAIRRQDGQVQVTVGGMPVYRFSGDLAPGDLKGQGIGGTWFAVGPTGAKVTQ